MHKYLVFMLLCAIPVIGGQITKGPYLTWQENTSNSITVNWETDGEYNSIVEYGTSLPLTSIFIDNAEKHLHHITLTALSPNTTYYYRVSSTGGPTSEVYQFTTGYNQKVNFRFAILGDTRTGHQIHQNIINAIELFNPDFYFNTGDMVKNPASSLEWDTFFQIEQNIQSHIPFMPTRGNHEVNSTYYQDFFELPANNNSHTQDLYYAFSYGNAYFIVLESGLSGYWIEPGGDEYEWLKSKLEYDAQNYDWIFIVFHNPPYGSGHHLGDSDIANYWVPLFETYHVDVCFNGHNHFYERSVKEGIQYVTIGGGGAPLRGMSDPNANPYRVFFEEVNHYAIVDIQGPVMTYKAYRLDGTVMDQFEITKDITLPIFLSRFEAIRVDEYTAQIQWQTESEIDLEGFNLYRKGENQPVRQQISGYRINPALKAAGSSTITRYYQFTDNYLRPGETYLYWLEAQYYDGTAEMFGPVEVGGFQQTIPTSHRLLVTNYPNPFNNETTISIQLPVTTQNVGPLNIRIYDLSSRLVYRLKKWNPESGNFTFNWCGTDESGNSVSSGIYLLQVQWGGLTRVHKLIYLK